MPLLGQRAVDSSWVLLNPFFAITDCFPQFRARVINVSTRSTTVRVSSVSRHAVPVVLIESLLTYVRVPA